MYIYYTSDRRVLLEMYYVHILLAYICMKILYFKRYSLPNIADLIKKKKCLILGARVNFIR